MFGVRIALLEFTVILATVACKPEEPPTGNTGGSSGSLGGGSSGGVPSTGGLPSTGGTSAVATGGRASGGVSTGGSSTGGTATGGSTGPCDIYQSGNTPCVAAHSTVRSLFGSYSGNLYQVRRASDKTTKDVAVLSPGGYANSATQDTFCSGTTCTISIIYDQSTNANHLTKSPPGGWLNNGGLEADATAAKIKVGGHTVYGVYTTMNWDNDIGAVGYRNNQTKGVAIGDQPESMYMVVDGKRYNQWCCFDYGNAETNNLDNGNATMEAVYFGSSTQWAVGNGAGPWVLADLENGVFHGGDPNAVTASNTPMVANYVTAMLKGPSGNRFALKAGDAQSGTLAVKYDGPRPAGYSPQKKEGAIILGTGGDNSHTGIGTFFEGCMTAGNPSDAIDNAVQANIVAAKYGS
jgi:non-reducing end alpha-L-arabinofuranosidase